MRLPILSFEQPIGEFALSVMSVQDILKISFIDRREYDHVTLNSAGGPQRQPSNTRINEIAQYSETPDATFPTPILLALPENSYSIDDGFITIDESRQIASTIDGQHRMLGLANSKRASEFVLPVVFVLDATDEQKALIFAIINGKQTRVPASVIYDLFNVVEGRNPFRTAHEIARAMNSDEASPFYRRLKMLGRKFKGSNESLSQGTFVTQLIRHISNNPTDDFNRSRSKQAMLPRPNSVFNKYFLQEKDEVILKILFNLFGACKEVFKGEWENPEQFILSKTTGYTGIMKALPVLVQKGEERRQLTKEYFTNVFINLQRILAQQELALKSAAFPPNNTGESKLRDLIIEATERAIANE